MENFNLGKAVADLSNKQNMHTLSLCMIVYNEEKTILDCLLSFRPYVNEICIVDTGSTDDTLILLENFKNGGANVKIESIAWENDFSKARNKSLSMATSRLIIWADADDVLHPDSGSTLSHFKKNYKSNTVYMANIHNFKGGKVFNKFLQTRLFPNDELIRFNYKVHENINDSATKNNYKFEVIPSLVIEHKGYDVPIEALMEKVKRNYKIMMDDKTEREDRMYYIGNYYKNMKDPHNAIGCYLNVIRENKTSKAIINKSKLFIGIEYEKLESYDLALHWYSQCEDSDANFRMAECYLKMDDIMNAKIYFEKYVNQDEYLCPVGNCFGIQKQIAISKLKTISYEEYEYWNNYKEDK